MADLESEISALKEKLEVAMAMIEDVGHVAGQLNRSQGADAKPILSLNDAHGQVQSIWAELWRLAASLDPTPTGADAVTVNLSTTSASTNIWVNDGTKALDLQIGNTYVDSSAKKTYTWKVILHFNQIGVLQGVDAASSVNEIDGAGCET